MTLMTYKGYTAQIDVDPEAKVLAGRVLDLRDVIVFEGETVEGVEREFHTSIDDYLTWCAEEGRAPEKPYSGRLPFRTTPETHRKIALAAARAGKSINAWMEEVLVGAAANPIPATRREPDIEAIVRVFQSARADRVIMDPNADRLIATWPTSITS
jgi:predicted HicB family RNase H-like nuclease